MAGNKWQISDEIWEKMAPLIPEHKTQHPLGNTAGGLIIAQQ